MIIRHLKKEDKDELLDLFCTTINTVNLGDYTQEQVSMWGSRTRHEPVWNKSFDNKEVFVCEVDGSLLGFCELQEDGYIDRFFVASESVGKGVGKKLFSALETSAKEQDIKELYANASITAKPFFEKLGFIVQNKQTVYIEEIQYTNYRVVKTL